MTTAEEMPRLYFVTWTFLLLIALGFLAGAAAAL
jgi:hypothetical protein